MATGFGRFAFDRQSRLLWRDGTEIALPPRVLGVLEVLLDRPGQVVARQDLLDGVWKDAFVTDTSLAEAVSFLRQALGDDPHAPRYIQTVHRRGYRFLAPLTETPLPGLTEPERSLTPDAPTRSLTPIEPSAGQNGVRLRPAASDGQVPAAASAVQSAPAAWELVPWSVAILCAAIAASAVWRMTRLPAPEAPPVARFEVRPADGTSFDRRAPALAISQDGRLLAWSACEAASGACALYVRPVDRLQAERRPGTDGGSSPFFSPDARWIGFFADGKLKKIATAGGSPSIVADAPSPGGGAWAPDGRIAFAGAPAGGLSLVSDQGGAVTVLTTPRPERGEVRHRYPSWLPGGRGLVFTSASSPIADAPGDLAVVALGSASHGILRSAVTRAASAGNGYLLLARGSDLQAVAFDERTLSLAGSTESVLSSVTGGDEGVAEFAISPSGTLAAIRTARPKREAWIDRNDEDAGPIGRLTSLAVSPDSRRAAGVLADSNSSDIWMADLATGGLTRITYGGINASPAWSADGQRLFFASRTSLNGGTFGIASRGLADRAATQPIARAGSHVFPSSSAPDGRLAVTVTLQGGRTAIGIIPPGGNTEQLAILSDGPFDEAAPAFSPDGRWLALETDESGVTEVVLRAAAGGRRIAVSTGGGAHPRWSADGHAVYFEAGRRLMRAPFDPARDPAVDKPIAVFDRAAARVLAVTPTGRLLVEDQAPSGDVALVILQWLRELRQRLTLPVTTPR